MKNVKETMIVKNGKLIYAISLNKEGDWERNDTFVYIDKGEVYFSDSYFSKKEFDVSEEAHRIAKEIFISELQTDIKRRILELKQLQLIFKEMDLGCCFGTVLEDNTKILLEVKEQLNKVSAGIKSEVADAIEETVVPLAIKKGRKKGETVSKSVATEEIGV